MKIAFFESGKLAGSKVLIFLSIGLVLTVLVRFYTVCQDYDLYDKALYEQESAYYNSLPEEEASSEIAKDCDGINLVIMREMFLNSGYDEETVRLLTVSEAEKYGADYDLFVREYEELIAGLEDPEAFSSVLGALSTQFRYRSDYRLFLEEMPERAKELEKVNIFSGKNTFTYRSIGKSAGDYQKLTGIEIKPGYEQGILALTQDSFSIVVLMLLAAAAAVILYAEEKDTGLAGLLRSTRKGRVELALSKWVVLTAYTLVITTVVYIGKVVMAGTCLGFGDLSRSLQSVRYFRDCSLNVSVRDYLVYSVVFPASVMILYASAISFLFVLIPNAFAAGACSGLIVLSHYLFYILIRSNSSVNFLRYLNLFSISDTGRLFSEYGNIDLFGHPVSLFPSDIVFLILMTGLFVSFTVFLYARLFDIRWPRIRLFSRRIRIRGSVSLIRQENYRIGILFFGLLILAGFLVINERRVMKEPLRLIDETYIYYSFGKEIEGEITEKTDEWIAEKRNELSTGLRISRLEDGETEESGSYLLNTALLQENYLKQKAFEKISNEYAILSAARARGIPVHYISTVQTDPAFEKERTLLLYTFFLMIGLTVCVCPLFALDRDSGMESLVRTTGNGTTRLFLSRHLVILGFYAVCFMLFQFPFLYNLCAVYRFRDFSAPIQSVVSYAHLAGNMTVGETIAFKMILSFFSGLGFIELMCFLSVLTRRRSTTLVVSAIILAVDFLISFIRVPFLSKAVLSSGAAVTGLLKEAGHCGFVIVIFLKNLLLTAGLFFLHLRFFIWKKSSTKTGGIKRTRKEETV